MASFLRKNTAVRVCVGPFLDKTDGVTPEVALTVTGCHITAVLDDDDNSACNLIIDADATASGGDNDMVHITNDNAGYYDLELTAAQTNYNGRFKLAITDAATHCPVFHEFMILPAMVFDSLVKGSDDLDVNATKINDVATTSVTTIAANVGTTQPVNFTGTGASALVKDDVVDIAGAAVNTGTAQLGVNVVTQANIDFGALQKASLNAATPASVTGAVGSVTGAVGSVTGAVGSVTGSVGSIATGGIAATSFAAGAIDAAAIATGAIDADAIADNAIDSGAIAANAITAAKIATDAIGAAQIATDAITEIQAGLATATALGTAQTDLTQIKGDTTTDIPATLASILEDTGTTLPATLATIAGYLDTEIASILEDTGTTLPAQIAALNNLAITDIRTALGTNSSNQCEELTQAAPSATPSVAAAIMLLYMKLRNKETATATERAIYNDAGTKIVKAAISDDGTTYTKAEFGSGA